MIRVLGALLAIAPLAASAAGCAHSRTVHPTDEAAIRRLDSEFRDRTTLVVLGDGSRRSGSVIALDRDSIAWRGDGADRGAAALHDVEAIVRRSRGRGLVDGAAIGALAGAPLGALLIDEPSGGTGRRVEAAFSGAAAGALWGAAIGAIVGGRVRVEIAPRSDP